MADGLRERLDAIFDRRPHLAQSRTDEALAAVAAWLRDEAAEVRQLANAATAGSYYARHFRDAALALEMRAHSLDGEQGDSNGP